MNSNATNKTRTGHKRVRTQEPGEEQETQKSPPSSTPSSPTKAAKNALKLAVASLSIRLQPLVLHFGHQIITARCKQYAEKSIMQRMEEDTKYIPRSIKAAGFQNHPVGQREGGQRESILPRATDTTSKGLLRVLSQVCD